MHSPKLLVFIIPFLLMPFFIRGQSNITISHRTKDYGLYYRWVHDITQDKEGIIWMANHTGLRAYDGYDYLTFNHVPNDTNSISVNSIYRICAVGDHIWALGNDGIFNRVEISNGKVKRIPSPYYSTESYKDFKLRHFTESNEGDLLLFYQVTPFKSKNGKVEMWKYDAQVNSFKEIFSLEVGNEEVYHFSQRDNNDYWLWTKKSGYYLVDHKSLELKRFKLCNTGETERSNVNSSKRQGGEFCYPNHNSKDTNTLLSFKLPPDLNLNDLENLSVDNLNGIWFYNEDDVFRYDYRLKSLEHFVDPMFKNSRGLQKMHHFFVDKEGGFWNGHSIGAVRFKARQNLFEQYLDQEGGGREKTIFNSSIREIRALSRDQLLVRNDEEELIILDLKSKKFNFIDFEFEESTGEKEDASIHSMFISKDGYLWANSKSLIFKIHPLLGLEERFLVKVPQLNKTKTGQTDVAEVSKLFEDRNRNKWWCDKTGIYNFDVYSGKLKLSKAGLLPEDAEVDFEHASFDSVQNAIYGIYKNGIYIFYCDSEEVDFVEAFPGNESFDILTTDIVFWNGFFWLASNKGLIKVDPKSEEKTIYTRRDGLASTLVYSIIATENGLWLGSQNGLTQFDPITLQSNNFYTEQGLISNEFNTGSKLEGLDGRLYFGSQDGIIGFQPESFSFDSEPKGRLHLSNLSTFNKKNDALRKLRRTSGLSDKIVIRANEKNVELRFVLALYEDIASNQYSYFLEGIDNSWIDNGSNNVVRYSYLPSGKYKLSVKAKGPSKVPALNEISIPFVVREYWYKSRISFLLYFLAFVFGTWKLYQYQLSQRIAKQESIRIKEIDDLRTRMYTNITHEFRTPLTVILGMNNAINNLAVVQDDIKLKHAAEMINRNGNDLLGLINQLLDLSKLQDGKLKVNYLQGNIVVYIKYLVESLSSLAAEKGIKIHFSAVPDSILMDFDKEKISHIVLNLLSNAIKFTYENGNVYIDIRKKNYLSIAVKDDGIGIKEDQIDKVFDRFYQSDIGHTRKNEGTGIGLFLVKELVRLLNGKIELESVFHEGSEFKVLLPIINKAPLESTSEILNESTGKTTNLGYLLTDKAAFDNETLPLLVIVEDNRDVATYIASILDDDYNLLFARNGEEGIQLATQEIPDLLISDVMMPKKDGFELCSELKKDEKTSHIPIILLTAKADAESKIAGLEFGADAYLAKPFDSRELLIRIRNLLDLRENLRRRFQGGIYSKEITSSSKNLDPFLLKVKEAVLENIDDENYSVGELCSSLHISRAQLHRKLTALTGRSTSHLIKSIKLEKAQTLLLQQQMNISEVAYSVGFKTQAHFSRVFSEVFGISPSEFQSKSENR